MHLLAIIADPDSVYRLPFLCSHNGVVQGVPNTDRLDAMRNILTKDDLSWM